MLFMLMMSTSIAGEAAYYNPDQVAASSTTFARYAAELGPKSDDLERQAAVAGQQIEELEIAVLLMGAAAPESLRTYHAELRRTYAQQGLEASSFNNWIQDVSTDVFMQSLQMEAKDLGGGISECKPKRGGMGMGLGPGGGGSGPACTGENQSLELAKAMDASAELTQVVDQLLAEEWPVLKLEGSTQPTVAVPGGGTGSYIRIGPLAEELMGPQIEGLEAGLEKKLRPLEADLAAGGPAAQTALKQAEQLRKDYEAALARQGDKLMAGLGKALKGKDVGVCANPPSLGGCEGVDKTQELVPGLLQDKKLKKAVE